MKKVVFLGGKEIGHFCLEYLLKNSKELDVKIIAVLTSNKSISNSQFSFSDLCQEHGVEQLSSLDEMFNLDDFDVLLSIQYHQILKDQHIKLARQIAVNLHMAPLPEYRGCNQFSFAIIDQVLEFGTTLHRLDKSIDGGDLLFERRFPIDNNIFVTELYEQTFQESKMLFTENIDSIIRGEYQGVPQDQLPAQRSRGFHLRKEMQGIKRIDSDWPIEKQKRHFRATYFPPFSPPVVVSHKGEIELDMDWYLSL